MTYDLAKQLKDAGFPQKDFTPSDIESFAQEGRDSAVTFPTLEELIEACGEKFHFVEQNRPGEWGADDKSGSIYTVGPTPTEAVAKLWIALNPKP